MSDINDLVENLYKAKYKTRDGRKFYVDGPNAGLEVGKVRGRHAAAVDYRSGKVPGLANVNESGHITGTGGIGKYSDINSLIGHTEKRGDTHYLKLTDKAIPVRMRVSNFQKNLDKLTPKQPSHTMLAFVIINGENMNGYAQPFAVRIRHSGSNDDHRSALNEALTAARKVLGDNARIMHPVLQEH